MNYQGTEHLSMAEALLFTRFAVVPGTTILVAVPLPIASTAMVVTTTSASVLFCCEFRFLREDSVFPLLSFAFTL